MGLKRTITMAMAIFVSACGNFTAQPDTEEPDTDSEMNPMTYQAALSDCGGFDVTVELSEYCAAEVLTWDYDPSTKLLIFSDSRIVLNCCGEHDMSIQLEDGVYTITEYDRPMQGRGGIRCVCICPFDYEIEVQDMPAGEIQVQLLRDISDDERWNNTLVWEGKLDLTQESGNVVIDDVSAEDGCEPDSGEWK